MPKSKIVDGKIVLSEQQIVNQIIEYLTLNKIPFVHHRNTGAIKTLKGGERIFVRPRQSQKGVADFIICHKGHAISCEVKSESGHMSTEQLEWMDHWAENGKGVAIMVRSLDELIQHLTP
jgi:hypothetical protein